MGSVVHVRVNVPAVSVAAELDHRSPSMMPSEVRGITALHGKRRSRLAGRYPCVVGCRRVSRITFRCSFMACGDVGRVWEGSGLVRSLRSNASYEFAVHVLRLVQQPDRTIKIEDGGDIYWQGLYR